MVASPEFASELLAWAALDKGPRLAAGLHRSYGDTGLFSDGRMILTPRLDRLLSFDKTTGIVKAQAGTITTHPAANCGAIGLVRASNPGHTMGNAGRRRCQ